MCGIMGWEFTKKLQVSREQRAILAAILSTRNDDRGGDSWGFYDGKQIRRGLKDIAPMSLAMATADTLVAHTRKATTGAKTVENAHPFTIGNIIGAHNGMISNHDSLNKKHNRNYEVDSMHLFGHLNESKPFDEIYGYGSIEFIKKNEPGKIFLCKMKSGELGVYGIGSKETKNVKGVLWSSDSDHAEEAMRAAKIPFFKYATEEETVYFIQNGTLYESKDKLTLGSNRSSYLPDWRDGLRSSAWEGWEDVDSKDKDQNVFSFSEKRDYNDMRRIWKEHTGASFVDDVQDYGNEKYFLNRG